MAVCVLWNILFYSFFVLFWVNCCAVHDFPSAKWGKVVKFSKRLLNEMFMFCTDPSAVGDLWMKLSGLTATAQFVGLGFFEVGGAVHVDYETQWWAIRRSVHNAEESERKTNVTIFDHQWLETHGFLWWWEWNGTFWYLWLSLWLNNCCIVGIYNC